MEGLLPLQERFRDTSSVWRASTNDGFIVDTERTPDPSSPSFKPRTEQDHRNIEAYCPSQDQSRRQKCISPFGSVTSDPAFQQVIQSSASSLTTSSKLQDPDIESLTSNSTLELVQRSEFLIGATSASAGPSSNSVTGFQPLVVPDFLFIFDGSRVSVIPWNQSQCDQSVDVAAAPLMAKNPKEKVYLMKQVAMALRHNQRLQDIENPEGAPLDARELKLSSAFRSHKPGRKTETYKEGQKSTDFRSWNDGFDAKLFARSQRLFSAENMPPLVRYRLIGNLGKLKAYYSDDDYFRRRQAFKQLLDATPLNPNQSNAPAPPGFAKLATAFFNGEAIDGKFDDVTIGEENALENAIAECLRDFDRENGREVAIKKLREFESVRKALPSSSTIIKNHVITYQKSAWVELANQIIADIEQVSDKDNCHLPFKNKAHKALGLFLQDVMVANELEKACVEKTAFGDVKVFREPSYQRISDSMRLTSAGHWLGISEVTTVDVAGTLSGSTLVIRQVDGESDESFSGACQALLDAVNDRKANVTTATASSNSEERSEYEQTRENAAIISAANDSHSNVVSLHGVIPIVAEVSFLEPVQDTNSPEAVQSQPTDGSADKNVAKRAPKGKDKSKSAKSKSSSKSKHKKSSQIADLKNDGEEGYEEKIPDADATEQEDSKASKMQPEAEVSKISDSPLQKQKKSGSISVSDYEEEPDDATRTKVDEGWQTVKAKPSQRSKVVVRGASQGSFRGSSGGSHRSLHPQASLLRQNFPQQPDHGPNSSQAAKQINISKQSSIKKSVQHHPAAAVISDSSAPKIVTKNGNSIHFPREEQKLPIFDEEQFPTIPSKSSKPSKDSASFASPHRDTHKPFPTTSAETYSLQNGDRIATNGVPFHGPEAVGNFESPVYCKQGEHYGPIKSHEPTHLSDRTIEREEDVEKERGVKQVQNVEQVQNIKREQNVEQDRDAVLDVSANRQDLTSMDKANDVTSPTSVSVPETVPQLCVPAGRLVSVDGSTDIEAESATYCVTVIAEYPVDDSLSWAEDALSSPSKFESGSRRTSLPSASYRLSEGSLGASPIFRRVRPRSKSVNTGLDQEQDRNQEFSDVSSDAMDDAVSHHSSVNINDSILDNHTDPLVNGSVSNQEEPVSTVAKDNPHECTPEIQLQEFAATLSDDLAHLHSQISVSEMAVHIPFQPSVLEQGNPITLDNDGQTHYRANTGGEIGTQPTQGGMHYQGNEGSVASSFNMTPASNVGSREGETPVMTEADERQNTPLVAYHCSLCNGSIVPSLQTPLVFCPGCGPKCNIRYCSVACLLVDSYDHTFHCINYPASERAAPHNLPAQFIYETDPIISMVPEGDSKEKFRQKAFSMYCRYGPFPKLLTAWAKRYPGAQSLQELELIESRKTTGDYHIFSSRATSSTPRLNDKADVIFTVSIAAGHPMKNILTRALNACFVIHHPRVVEFVFRMIRSFLIDPTIFQQFPHHRSISTVFTEFNHQFKKEFGFDADQQVNQSDIFDFHNEVVHIMPALTALEAQYPVLQYWNRS